MDGCWDSPNDSLLIYFSSIFKSKRSSSSPLTKALTKKEGPNIFGMLVFCILFCSRQLIKIQKKDSKIEHPNKRLAFGPSNFVRALVSSVSLAPRSGSHTENVALASEPSLLDISFCFFCRKWPRKYKFQQENLLSICIRNSLSESFVFFSAIEEIVLPVS